MHDHVRSLFPRITLSRRGFVASSITAGFTLAAGPLMAETIIKTDTKGLTVGDIKIPAPDGTIDGYYAMPATGGPFPVILVVMEVFGLHEHIKDICRRLAKIGYMGVAPDLYARQGDLTKQTDIREIMKIILAKPDSQLMSDLDATTAWAKASGKGNVAKLGITGFCNGGRTVWLYAAHSSQLKAGVAWYGHLGGQPTPNRPKSVLELASQIKAPVLGLYGGADQGIPIEQIDKMKAELKADHKPCEIVVYPDTGHAFNADYRATYREGPAKDGWKRMQAWFKQHGVA
ncbi:MAG: dienelactone hydrolase family protein [Candidatus Eiseniibacteriota bacterium]